MVKLCGCTQCPFCGSFRVEIYDEIADRCECFDCDEEWTRRPCCGDECELDHDYIGEE